ncbi:site-specific integrase [Mariniflexile gromovii]|uniref:Site-specific integrase n=1 Tax=Mariniflexile gromovii TaxID=362523 RepID=A0ABS4BTW1_9FLAO|nr:site-specific integrase [Mariniflexile gromovii]MBP0904022.1 site-specific integrase [Mariniflexile gromovii]
MQTSMTFSVHFWLNAAKKKDDIAPLYARVTVNGKRAEISLKRYLSVTYWDPKSKRAKPRTPNASALNAYLDQVYADLLECQRQLQSEFKLVTAQAIKFRYLGEDDDQKTLLYLVDYHNTTMKAVLKFGTLKNYYTTERYLKRFLKAKIKSSDIYLKQLSYGFIIDFEQFLRKGPTINKGQPLRNNGVMKHLERLKKMMNLALNLEWIEKDPFIRFKLKFTKHQRDYLSKMELQRFEQVMLEEEVHRKTRNIFIFSCYTGLSYTDVRSLTDNNIVRGIDGDYWIFTQREKTAQSVKIPLLEKALNIIKKYNGNIESDSGLLPVYTNQRLNVYLKEITALLEIKKNITFHSARHTFATTVTLSNGVPIETVSKLLGHSKLSTTQVYARVIEEKVSVDMKTLSNKLNNQINRNTNEAKVNLNS